MWQKMAESNIENWIVYWKIRVEKLVPHHRQNLPWRQHKEKKKKQPRWEVLKTEIKCCVQ